MIHTGHHGPWAFELNLDGLPADEAQFTAYIATIETSQLETLRQDLRRAFDALFGDDENAAKLDKAATAKLARYAMQVRHAKNELETRARNEAAEQAAAAAEAQRVALSKLRDGVHAASSSSPAPAEEGEETDDADDDEESVASSARRFAEAMETMVRRMTPAADVVVSGGDLNRSLRVGLGEVGRRAPAVAAPRPEPVLVAASGLPGAAPGGRIAGINELVMLMGARARMMQVTHGQPQYVPVATLQREHRYRLGMDSTPAEVSEVLTAAADVSALAAAGGWCAPSEISYDFYNIVCEDGMVDLPTVGVLNRGGFRFPTSPSINDILAQVPSPLWSWTETQDVAAATGTGQSGTKTCARVICPAFNDVRASCDGLCVTAGNLIDFAYPEAVANYLRLVMAARAHVTNQRIIAAMTGAATAVGPIGAAGEGAAAPILGALELLGTHTRERFRMCGDAVIEVMLPRWVGGMFRSDLAKRNGVDLLGVTDGQIADWFNLRKLRIQLVADWQNASIGHATVNPTSWPTSVQALVYPAGNFVRGQGLQLDLGVVRDSTLNATNDHTAAWMEDCYAVAQVGHGSLLATVNTCTDGTVGAADLTTCAA